MNEKSADHENALLKLLTEDIQSHRDYIHRLYRSAFTVGAVLVAIGVGLGYWILGKQLDAKVFEYRVVESLKKRADDISKEVISDAKLGAQEQVSLFIEEQIENKAAEKIQLKIQELNAASLTNLFEKAVLPKGAVIPFDRASGCPDGWSDYAPAYGRFIRGIDKSGKNIDPGGARIRGSIQDDEFAAHDHTIGVNGTDTTAMAIGGATQRLAHFNLDQYGSGNPKRTGVVGGVENRPKNVALLYCIKQK